ncbi:MAG: diaminopimelate decarboxylase [Thermomicrobiales bacterium]|nr:diaminopimelate decarboxylase [Thermomicrobiales bacterium]
MTWPATAEWTPGGELTIGGVAASALAERYGTPLYVFDEATLRGRARAIRAAFTAAWPRSRVVYAGKAYLSPTLAAMLWEEGIGLDVVGGGELYAGLAAGVPAAAMTMHGNNKSERELREALEAGIGSIAVDNDLEIEMLARLATEQASPIPIVMRLNPGIIPNTHAKMLTGALDSKFGFPITTGAAAAAVDRVVAAGCFDLAGYHAHVGSQVFDPALVAETIGALLAFAAIMRDRHGIAPRTIVPGGGFGVADDASGDDVSIETWATTAAAALREGCARYGFAEPELVVEPGRAIIGPAGVTLYRVGARKEIPGVRTYVSVDGGMSDNIRPALYGAAYSAALANRTAEGPYERVSIAGKYCESGDVLIEAIDLPRLQPGDLLAVPMTGAYCLAMASNYNLAPRPAAVLVNDGVSRLFRRRETYADVLASELLPELATS